MRVKKYEVSPGQLRWTCDPNLFQFESTKTVAPLNEFIGQDRASRALEFGLNMTSAGYNIFVTGLTGTGKTSMVKTYIERLIQEREARGETFPKDDWCYIYNFKEPDRPQVISLPQGKGKVFQSQIAALLNRIREDVGKAFASEEYNAQKKKTVDEGRSQQQKIFEEISDLAQKDGFLLQMTVSGPVLVPIVDGRPMEDKDFLSLDQTARKEIQAKQTELLKKLEAGFGKAGTMQQKVNEQLQKADKDVGEFTISKLFAPLSNEYATWPKVSKYITDLKDYTLNNLDNFKTSEEPVNPVFGVPLRQVIGGRDPFLPFQINVFVDNSECKCPPIIVESNPNFGNIFGKIERRFLFGGYLSDHTMLKAGALNLANGGYLILNVYDVLANVGVWPALKRAIRNKEVRIEDPFEQFGVLASQGMKPEPMPIEIKIVLIGETRLYQLLAMYDEDFWEIFKVKSDFNFEIDKTDKNMMDYAAFIASCCEECGSRHLDPAGVARVIEYSARIVADQERLSSRFSQIKELILEANFWAEKDAYTFITASHIRKAIDERMLRHNLVDERIRDMINRGLVMIDVEGAVVGQVNGLSVYSLGDAVFGRPSRITAKTFLGRDGVINIERESELSGPIHNKGVMILSGYLGWKYAQDKPLSLSASLCFEQSYEGVEGDSASSTELYAILSSLSGAPIKQSIAVTGSVNQKEEIQPIGGVNQKIEGFFRVCKAKGLTGEQGVLIPYQNLRNLMLREEVVDAARSSYFHIYTAKNIDEGIEILTGIAAGKRKKDGAYPQDTINFRVDKQLKDMANKLKSFYSREKN